MKLKLIEKRDEAKGTKSFFWQASDPIFFTPGQYFYYTLPKLNYPDERGATRHFTLANSPVENSLLRLTTRIRQESGFKKTLDELPIGAEIEGQGPNGTFIFDEKSTEPHIFLAGGIGITPFRSMINYDLTRDLKIPIYLLYSNSNADEVTFGQELRDWDKTYDYFTMQEIITTRDGRIDELKINKFIENCKLKIENCSWWICGPPPFIDAMEGVLGAMKITVGKVHSEKFTGY